MNIHDENDFKKLSLEDNFYFTLRDMFWNGNTCDFICDVNEIQNKLTNDISLNERTDLFQYTNLLNNSLEMELILYWLNRITPQYFNFEEEEQEDDVSSYMLFDEWWNQFLELRKLMNEHYEKINL